MRAVSDQGESAMFFIVYVGHAVLLNGETHAVMSNGQEFINLKDYVLCCAKHECLVLGIFDCLRQTFESEFKEDPIEKLDENYPG
jgi:hypothetical protein